jgi:hypothetical protein
MALLIGNYKIRIGTIFKLTITRGLLLLFFLTISLCGVGQTDATVSPIVFEDYSNKNKDTCSSHVLDFINSMSLTTNLKGYKIISFVLSYSVPIDVKDWYIGNKDLVCDSSALSDSLKVIMMGDYNSLNKDRRVTITNILAITPKGEIIWLNDLSIKIKADCEKNKTNTPFKPKRNGNKKAT